MTELTSELRLLSLGNWKELPFTSRVPFHIRHSDVGQTVLYGMVNKNAQYGDQFITQGDSREPFKKAVPCVILVHFEGYLFAYSISFFLIFT